MAKKFYNDLIIIDLYYSNNNERHNFSIAKLATDYVFYKKSNLL